VSGAPLIGPGGACAFALPANASASAAAQITLEIGAGINSIGKRNLSIGTSISVPMKSSF
jgi:hypothetical protein